MGILLLWLGFFLSAAGVPVPSAALFPNLVLAGTGTRQPTLFGILFSSTATLCGHIAAMYWFGAISKAKPKGKQVVSALAKVAALASGERTVAALTALSLRWVGGGYSQVFWALGAGLLPSIRGFPLALLVNDVAWCAAWYAGWSLFGNRFPDVIRLASKISLVFVGATLYGWTMSLRLHQSRQGHNSS